MDPAARLRERIEAIMEQMGRDVLLHDLRHGEEPRLLRGYRTKGKGKDAPDVFRFLDRISAIQVGTILQVQGEADRWLVTGFAEEAEAGQALFFSAEVANLSGTAAILQAPKLEDVGQLLQEMEALLDRSTLGPLERDDVREALRRLEALAKGPQEEGVRPRAKLRLLAVKEGFKRCPQTGPLALPLCLKLEAQLKRLKVL